MELTSLIYLTGLILAVVSFLLQTWPRFGNRYFGIDVWRHLAVADYYRRRRQDRTLAFNRYLIPEPSDYPPLLRIFLSLIPKETLERTQWFIGPLFDFVQSFAVFVVAYSITGSLSVSLASQIAYIVAPVVVMENSSLSTRPLASLLFTGLLLVELGYATSGNWAWFLLALPVSTLLFLTHRMGLQALIVVSVVLSLWFLSAFYILTFVGGWALATVVSRGYYWRVFVGHMAMLNWWRKNIHHRYAHQIRGLPKKSEDSADPVFRIYQFVRRAPFMAVLAANAFAVLVVVIVLDRTLGWGIVKSAAWNRQSEFFSVWAMALLVTGVLVRQIRALEFVGEGERYGEYSAFPIALIVGMSLGAIDISLSWIGWLAFASIAVVGGIIPALFVQYRVIVGDTGRSLTPSLELIMTRINKLDPPARLMTIPLSLADMALQFSNARLLSTDSSYGHLRHYSDFFPVLQVPIAEIFQRFEISHILLNEGYVCLNELGLTEEMVLERRDNFCLLEVDAEKQLKGTE